MGQRQHAVAEGAAPRRQPAFLFCTLRSRAACSAKGQEDVIASHSKRSLSAGHGLAEDEVSKRGVRVVVVLSGKREWRTDVDVGRRGGGAAFGLTACLAYIGHTHSLSLVPPPTTLP
ncbi:uncharacterized protein K452DRAFT_285720 [Aplosporella prunicola CBS 121167]|uniref:Uncharacterized protein n=1 Tax=Aplosporella prunicola CBS 121167 TaxID=1176127 RepID=A0A6A6BJ94_9PEZI|nr:uncharacterized protein K452DRAFT_285720 [Aplosporella prunicola CBS 121167]KAF2143688.1 hypothetical protein K452DRAFT_285720 [Aplosporella prunicola CBS 121167]